MKVGLDLEFIILNAIDASLRSSEIGMLENNLVASKVNFLVIFLCVCGVQCFVLIRLLSSSSKLKTEETNI